MSEIPEKQIKRLRSLIDEAETNLSAAKELLISLKLNNIELAGCLNNSLPFYFIFFYNNYE